MNRASGKAVGIQLRHLPTPPPTRMERLRFGWKGSAGVPSVVSIADSEKSGDGVVTGTVL